MLVAPQSGGDQEVQKRVYEILDGLKQYSLETYFAGEIVRFVREVSSDPKKGWIGRSQNLDRVKSRLHIAWQFYNNADYIFNCLAAKRTSKLIHELDIPLQRKWYVAGGLLGGLADYEKWATNPFLLKTYAKAGIVEAEKIWKALMDDADREKFIYFVFEHDKGYHQIVEHCRFWNAGERPQDLVVPDDVIVFARPQGVGGFVRQGGRKTYAALISELGLPKKIKTVEKLEQETRKVMTGRWVNAVLFVEGLGSIKLTIFYKDTREYAYMFLGEADMTGGKYPWA